jgi:hypothetical protein
VPTQFVVFRVTDVETGVSTEESVILTGVATATSSRSSRYVHVHGRHHGGVRYRIRTVLVFDGVPPYTATSTFAEVAVSPATSSAQPGLFTFNVGNPNVCLTDADHRGDGLAPGSWHGDDHDRSRQRGPAAAAAARDPEHPHAQLHTAQSGRHPDCRRWGSHGQW